MSRERVYVEGLLEVLADLRRAGASAADLADVHKTAARFVADDARRRTPRRSGRLAGSYATAGTATAGTVTAGGPVARYGPVIHFGWSTRGLGRRADRVSLRASLAGSFATSTLNKAARASKTRGARGAVRGGPIRPNPFLYNALDGRRQDVIDQFDRHLAAIARAFNT